MGAKVVLTMISLDFMILMIFTKTMIHFKNQRNHFNHK